MYTPKIKLQNNYSLIEKRCQCNWIDAPNLVLELLMEVIDRLEVLKFDNDQTRGFISKWLSEHNEIEAGVYSDLLFRSVEEDPSFVYATNYFIQRMNRVMYTNIPFRDDKVLKIYQNVLIIKDISMFDSFIMSSFPNQQERYDFLIFLFNEVSELKASANATSLTVSKTILLKKIKRLMTSIAKKLDEKDADNPKIELTAGQKALIIYYRYRRQKKTLMNIIQEAHEREGWKQSSYNHIKNLYDAIGKGGKKDPLTNKNRSAISNILSEEELQEVMK